MFIAYALIVRHTVTPWQCLFNSVVRASSAPFPSKTRGFKKIFSRFSQKEAPALWVDFSLGFSWSGDNSLLKCYTGIAKQLIQQSSTLCRDQTPNHGRPEISTRNSRSSPPLFLILVGRGPGSPANDFGRESNTCLSFEYFPPCRTSFPNKETLIYPHCRYRMERAPTFFLFIIYSLLSF